MVPLLTCQVKILNPLGGGGSIISLFQALLPVSHNFNCYIIQKNNIGILAFSP
jgi:hypothetical protein